MWALGQAGFYDLSQGLRGNRQSSTVFVLVCVLSPTFPTCGDRNSGLGVNEATVHIRAVTHPLTAICELKHMVTSKTQLLLQVFAWCLVRLRGGCQYVGMGGWIFLETCITTFVCRIRLLSSIWLARGKERHNSTHSVAVYEDTNAKCPAYYLDVGISNQNKICEKSAKTLFRNTQSRVSCLSPRLWYYYTNLQVLTSLKSFQCHMQWKWGNIVSNNGNVTRMHLALQTITFTYYYILYVCMYIYIYTVIYI